MESTPRNEGVERAGQPLARVLSAWTARLVQVRWLVGLALVLLGTAGPGGFRSPAHPDGLFVLGVAIWVYNLVFTAALAAGGADRPALFGTHRRLAFWQVTVDWLALISVLFLTGGPVNAVAVIFVFHVVLVAIYLPPRDCVISGSIATGVLVLGAALQLLGVDLPRSALWGGLAASPGAFRTAVFLLALIGSFTLTVYAIQRLGDRLWREERNLVELTRGLERWRDRARTLNRVSAAINVARDVRDVFDKTVEAATRVCEASASGLRVYDEKSGTLELVASVGLSPSYLRKGPVRLEDSPVDLQVRGGTVVAVPNLREDPLFQYPEAAEGEGIVSVLCAPLLVEGRFLGVLRIYDKEPRVFGPAAREFLAGLASLAAVAVQNVRAYAELEEHDRRTRDFVVGATHALRSPLAAMQNTVDVLLDGYVGSVDDRQRDLLLRIRRKNEHLLILVRELLYLTTRDLETAREEESRVDLGRVVKRVVENHREAAEDAGVTLDETIGPGDYALTGVPEEMGQMVANLVQNAIQYTPDGGKVTVSLAAGEDGFHLEIADTGIGIPADQLPLVFQPFHRAPNARERSEQGTGLGLALVKRIAERMDGRVTLESEPGKGTRVRVWLPRRSAAVQFPPEEHPGPAPAG